MMMVMSVIATRMTMTSTSQKLKPTSPLTTGYDVMTTATGGFIIMVDEDGKEVDSDEYVTFQHTSTSGKENTKILR